MPLRSWTSHGKLASLFCPATACLLHGCGRSAHVLPLNYGGPLAGMKLPCLDGLYCAELTPSPVTWSSWPPTQMPAITSIVTGGAGTCSGAKTPVGSASPTSISASASSTSSFIAPSRGRHSSYACTTSQPGADQDCSSTWSVLATHSPGTTSTAYQWPPSPPQFGHLQFSSPSGHGTNWEAVG